MIDLVIQAFAQSFNNAIYPFAEFDLRYSPSLDIVAELKKNPEIFSQKKIEFAQRPDAIPSFLMGLYRREALTQTALVGKAKILEPLAPTTNGEDFEAMEGTAARCPIRVELFSQNRELLENIEILYLTRIKIHTALSFSIQMSENSKPLECYYDLNYSDIEEVGIVDTGENGSLWAMSFSVLIEGVFFAGLVIPTVRVERSYVNLKLMEHLNDPKEESKFALMKDMHTGEIILSPYNEGVPNE